MDFLGGFGTSVFAFLIVLTVLVFVHEFGGSLWSWEPGLFLLLR